MDAWNTFFSFPSLGSSLLPFENQWFTPKRFRVFKKHLTEVLTTPRILQSVTLHLGETPNGQREGNPWNPGWELTTVKLTSDGSAAVFEIRFEGGER